MTNYPATVADKISAAMPWTIGLASVTTVLGYVVRFPGRRIDRVAKIVRTRSGHPACFDGHCRGTVFPLRLGAPVLLGRSLESPAHRLWCRPWFFGRLNIETVWQLTKHAVLPATAVIVASTGLWGLGMRAMMVTTAGEDYMLLADAKGLKERRIFLVYAIRNVLLPQTTRLCPLSLAGVVGGLLLVEIVFNYPGIGLLLRNAIGESDYFMIQGVTLITIFAVAFALFVMDLLYPLIDPRISYNRS